MEFELYIDGEKKTFTTPIVPFAARRKYFEIQANAEEREETPTTRELLKEDDEMLSILTDIVFQKQFTIEQLLEGASKEYIDEKLAEAIWGKRITKEGE